MSQLPWWLFAYAALFAAVTVFWVADEWKTERRVLPIALELGLDACLIVSAVPYWYSPIRAVVGGSLPLLYFLGFASVIVATARELPSLYRDSEISVPLRAAGTTAVILLIAVVYGPLLFWGASTLSGP